MTQRINYAKHSPQLLTTYRAFSTAAHESAIDQAIQDLVNIRASQLNGCAFCLDMLVKEAKIHGERELRLYHAAIWRESPLFTARERAALAWTEALTHISPRGVSDEIYEQVRSHFSDKELSDLTFMVIAINGWNRVNVAFRTVPGVHDVALGLDKSGLQ